MLIKRQLVEYARTKPHCQHGRPLFCNNMANHELFPQGLAAQTMLFAYPEIVDQKDCLRSLSEVFEFWRVVEENNIDISTNGSYPNQTTSQSLASVPQVLSVLGVSAGLGVWVI